MLASGLEKLNPAGDAVGRGRGLAAELGIAAVDGALEAVLAVDGEAGLAAAAVADLFADVLDGWLVDSVDSGSLDAITALGIQARARPLLMSDPAATRAIAAATLDLATDLGA